MVADAKPVHLGHTIKADGRWRLFAFVAAEDPVGPSSGLRTLCEFLAESPQSPVKRYTPRGADIDSLIDVRAVFQQGHLELAIEAMPSFLLPRKGHYGLRDYEKMCGATIRSLWPLMPAALGVAREDITAGDVWVATGADGQIAGVVALAPGDELSRVRWT